MRQLATMARGRQWAEWQRVATLIAVLRQAAHGEWEDPDRLNPYADPPGPAPEKSAEDLAAETKLAVGILRSMAR